MAATDEADRRSLGALPVRQQRSRQTRDAILRAVEDALESGRLFQATVQELSAAAGVSIGAFYGRFKSKDAAIAALFNQRRNGFVEKLTRLNTRAPTLEKWAAGAVKLAMNHALENRELIARAARPDSKFPSVQGASREDSMAAAQDLARELVRLAPTLPKHEALGVATFSIAMLGAMTRDAAVFSENLLGDRRTRIWLSENIAAAITAYVTSRCLTEAS